jgi:hypothetical protein
MTAGAAHPRTALEYDPLHRRVWICGQRCHHGATGAFVAVIAGARLIAALPISTRWLKRVPSIVALAAGSALMVHDWKDHEFWFERGHGSQP